MKSVHGKPFPYRALPVPAHAAPPAPRYTYWYSVPRWVPSVSASLTLTPAMHLVVPS